MNTLHKLGKLAPRVDPRTLKLEAYLQKVPTPPASISYQALVQKWPMFLNDSLGDCVIAAAAHMEQQWGIYGDGSKFVPTDELVLKSYEQIGGYIPSQPNTDNGCVILNALKVWKASGICGRKIAAYATVTPANPLGIKTAVYLFGNAYIGVQLPVSAQNQTEWIVSSNSNINAPGSWGGHCVPIVGYDTEGCTVITWGAPLKMTWDFFAKYCDEAYGVVSQDWIERNGDAPNGFNMGQLLADLRAVTA